MVKHLGKGEKYRVGIINQNPTNKDIISVKLCGIYLLTFHYLSVCVIETAYHASLYYESVMTIS